MINNKRTLLAVAVFGLATGALCGPRLLARWSPAVEFVAQGNMVEKAATVAEQTRRADLIVRARVVSLKNRVLSEVLPVYAEDAVTVLETRESSTPFTDVTLEVLENFKGESEPYITALQTGGTLRKGRFGRLQHFEIAADPLFEQDSEHILFLVDITGDGVHSTDRQLYRVVNPYGRYEIASGGSLRPPHSDEHTDRAILSRLPQTQQALRQEIRSALAAERLDSPAE